MQEKERNWIVEGRKNPVWISTSTKGIEGIPIGEENVMIKNCICKKVVPVKIARGTVVRIKENSSPDRIDKKIRIQANNTEQNKKEFIVFHFNAIIFLKIDDAKPTTHP